LLAQEMAETPRNYYNYMYIKIVDVLLNVLNY